MYILTNWPSRWDLRNKALSWGRKQNMGLPLGGNEDKDPWTEAVWKDKRNEENQRERNKPDV